MGLYWKDIIWHFQQPIILLFPLTVNLAFESAIRKLQHRRIHRRLELNAMYQLLVHTVMLIWWTKEKENAVN
jgi:hypothetical protein